MAVPASLDEVDPSWLTAALRANGVLAEGRVVAVRELAADLGLAVTAELRRIELEYAGVEQKERDVVGDLARRASKVIFDAEVKSDDLVPVVEAFDAGWNVEVSAGMPSPEYLAGLDEIPGLREAAAALAGSESPARLASAIEFLLEGLHLTNKLNKSSHERGARYARS